MVYMKKNKVGVIVTCAVGKTKKRGDEKERETRWKGGGMGSLEWITCRFLVMALVTSGLESSGWHLKLACKRSASWELIEYSMGSRSTISLEIKLRKQKWGPRNVSSWHAGLWSWIRKDLGVVGVEIIWSNVSNSQEINFKKIVKDYVNGL